MKNLTQLSFLFLSLVFYFTSYAQEPIYKHFGVDEGLPTSQIYDIYQGKNGYIWFATDKGVSRYNGYEFENFDINDGLPGNVVLRFYPQKNGEVWGYTFHNKGLFYFNENFDGFTTYKYNKILGKELKSNSIVKSLFIDKFNTLQLGGVGINGILSIRDNGKVNRNYTHKKFFSIENPVEKYIVLSEYSKEKELYFLTLDKDIIDDDFVVLEKGKNSHIDVEWLLYNEKAVFMDGNFIEIITKNKEPKIIKNNSTAIGIKAIDSTSFFAGYYFGGGKIINIEGEVLHKYLKEKSVTNFLIDHEGGYWFTTLNSGVYYARYPSITIFKQPNINTSLHINSLAKREKELLIGYKNGDFAKAGTNERLINTKSAVNASTIIEYDSISKKTYIYKNNQIIVNNNLHIDAMYSVKFSEPTLNGAIFSSFPSGFYEINKNKFFLFPKRVQDVSVWKKDTLIATPFGVFKKNKDTIIALSKESKLLGYRSDDIDVNTNTGNFFIATQGAGIVIYGKDIYNISKKDGLTSNIVNEIHIENDSTIYACTNKGLNRVVFNDTGFRITTINKETGLLSNEVEDVEIINDTLWIGTKEGLCYMPKKVLDNNTQLDSLYLRLKEIRVNDVIFPYKEGVKLNYDENKITFFIQGISYAKHNDLQYQYRLKETDRDWSSTKNRRISFPNLTHGQYTFQARICIGSKCDSEKQIEYKFIIKPPFWKSRWFYTLCFLVFGGLLYVFFKIRVLTYNKDVTREFLRLLIKWLKRDEKYLKIRMNGESIKIATNEIFFIKSSGNYLDIISADKIYTIRCKIGDFIATTPDALEYLRVHRSYIIRIDKVTGKSKKSVTLKDHIIPVGETYLKQLNNIQF